MPGNAKPTYSAPGDNFATLLTYKSSGNYFFSCFPPSLLFLLYDLDTTNCMELMTGRLSKCGKNFSCTFLSSPWSSLNNMMTQPPLPLRTPFLLCTLFITSCPLACLLDTHTSPGFSSIRDTRISLPWFKLHKMCLLFHLRVSFLSLPPPPAVSVYMLLSLYSDFTFKSAFLCSAALHHFPCCCAAAWLPTLHAVKRTTRFHLNPPQSHPNVTRDTPLKFLPLQMKSLTLQVTPIILAQLF